MLIRPSLGFTSSLTGCGFASEQRASSHKFTIPLVFPLSRGAFQFSDESLKRGRDKCIWFCYGAVVYVRVCVFLRDWFSEFPFHSAWPRPTTLECGMLVKGKKYTQGFNEEIHKAQQAQQGTSGLLGSELLKTLKALKAFSKTQWAKVLK